MGACKPSQFGSKYFWRRPNNDCGKPGAMHAFYLFVQYVGPSTSWQTKIKGAAFKAPTF